jgi:hypothetical protein
MSRVRRGGRGSERKKKEKRRKRVRFTMIISVLHTRDAIRVVDTVIVVPMPRVGRARKEKHCINFSIFHSPQGREEDFPLNECECGERGRKREGNAPVHEERALGANGIELVYNIVDVDVRPVVLKIA